MAEKNMSYFMKGKAMDKPTEEVVVSKRFIDEKGKPVPFIMKGIDTKHLEEIRTSCTKKKFGPKRQVEEVLDLDRFKARLGIESTVYPNLKSQELLESYGLVDPVELVKEILSLSGEYAEWIEATERVNGFDEDFEDEVEEAKN